MIYIKFTHLKYNTIFTLFYIIFKRIDLLKKLGNNMTIKCFTYFYIIKNLFLKPALRTACSCIECPTFGAIWFSNIIFPSVWCVWILKSTITKENSYRYKFSNQYWIFILSMNMFFIVYIKIWIFSVKSHIINYNYLLKTNK